MAKRSKTTTKKRRLLPPPPTNQIRASQIRKIQFDDLDTLLQTAQQYPIYGCWVMEDWQEQGMTPVAVCRIISPVKYLLGSFVVDLYCLGVKDCLARILSSPQSVNRFVERLMIGQPLPCSVELAHEIIYGSIEFAAKYEFTPHPDFEKFRLLLDPPDAHPRNNGVEFGKDGKPFYIMGPNDTPYMSQQVMNKLSKTAGEGNFHFIVPLPPLDTD